MQMFFPKISKDIVYLRIRDWKRKGISKQGSGKENYSQNFWPEQNWGLKNISSQNYEIHIFSQS